MSNGQAVAKKNEIFDLIAKDDSFKRQVQMALPNVGVTAERLLRVVLTECRRTPKLLRCGRDSILEAVMMCAETGLLPGPMGFCHIIPYGREAQFQLGYKGLVALMWRSKQIKTIRAEVVYEKDEFEDRIDEPPHWRMSSEEDRGEPVGCFATIGTTSGGWVTKYWPWARVLQHRDQFSQGASRSDSPWKTNPEVMACKTLLIQAAKFAPISTEAQSAISADERAGLSLSDMHMPEPQGPVSVDAVVPDDEPDPDIEDDDTPKERFVALCEEEGITEDNARSALAMFRDKSTSELTAKDYRDVADNWSPFMDDYRELEAEVEGNGDLPL